MANLKLGSYNVKGLRDAKKRRKIFNHLNQRQLDIVCIQESHSQVKDEKLWKSEFGGQVFFSHGSNDSRGTMILIRKKAPIKIGSVESDNEGRLIIVEIFHEEKHFNVISMYAPNKDDAAFFIPSFKSILEFEQSTTSTKIFMGDFNLVLDLKLDKLGGKNVTHTKCVNVLTEFMIEEGLIDIWQVQHPDSKEMTWCKYNPDLIMEQLDYILCSSNLVPNVAVSGISPKFLSDHAIPWIILKQSGNEKGQGFWILNTSLLSDPEFIKESIEIIQEAKSEDMQPVSKWEWLKYKFRKHAISYSSAQKRSNENKLLLYEKKLLEYNKRLIAIADEKRPRPLRHG